MKSSQSKRGWGIYLEYIFILAILAGGAYSFWFLHKNGYFPQPFFYEPSGTWMDWFAMAYWSHHNGIYDVLGAIYPPLSFVVLWIFGKGSCYVNEGIIQSEIVRRCDWVGIAAIHMLFVVNIILIARTFYKLDRRTALPRSIALAAGLPMLFALERGNLILLAFAFMLLAYGPLLKSARLRWICAGLAVNLKVYLIAAVLAPLLRRRWLAVEGAFVAIIGVYIVSWALLRQGSPMELYNNLTVYGSGFQAGSPLDLWYTSSYLPLSSLLTGSAFPIGAFLGSKTIDTTLVIISIYVNFGRAMILLAVGAIWFRPEPVPPHRVVLFGLMFALMNTEAGGYTEIFVFLFVFMERWEGFARPSAIIIAYILCIPGEYVIVYLPPLVRNSFMVGHEVIAQYGVGAMSLLRPGLVELISILLAGVTIRDVWIDVRDQKGVERRRFRRDAVFFAWMKRPAPRQKNEISPDKRW